MKVAESLTFFGERVTAYELQEEESDKTLWLSTICEIKKKVTLGLLFIFPLTTVRKLQWLLGTWTCFLV